MKPTAEELFGPAGTPKVMVVGAGFGGIATGVKMKRAGIDTFTIYESSLGIGGTWWDNTYPGAEVDVGSHLYCFSFKPHDWSRTHAKQPELQKYLEETVDEFGLRPHLRLGVTVESATWDDDRHVWAVHFDDGSVDECHVLVSGVGFLNVPRYPDWPGLDDFEGPKFHTARWEHQHDLTGKVVAVVGTGSSATQVVPAIQPIVQQIYVFQREPGWVVPKGERDFTDEERSAFTKPWRRTRERWRLKYMLEKSLWRGRLYRPGTKTNEVRERFCLDYIARQFADHPDLREAVTPKYPYPGKRPVVASTFYPALKKENVELVPRAVASVTRNGIVDADGVERPVDVVVMATGFQPANYLTRLRVVGRGGWTLQEHWASHCPRPSGDVDVREKPRSRAPDGSDHGVADRAPGNEATQVLYLPPARPAGPSAPRRSTNPQRPSRGVRVMSGARMRNRRIGRSLAVLVTLSVIGSLVGVSGASAQGGSPKVDQPGVSAKEIRVGGLATVSNDPTGNTLGSSFDGVEAYFKYINTTEKGVYGRKLVLDPKRDDQLGKNREQAQALISQDDIFAVLPVAVDLFTGADALAKAGIPTFGWDINPEWGSEDNKPGPPNFFGQFGSYICFSCAQPSTSVWLAKKLGLKHVGILGLNVPQSKAACEGVDKSFKKYKVAKVDFIDTSLAFGAVDYSPQVAQMVAAGVDYVVTCTDANGVATLAKEMKKQGLDAVQAMPNAYNHSFLKKNAEFLNGYYLFTVFAPFETKPKPPGLKLYKKWIKKTGGDVNENSITGWLNADLFVTGLKAAGPNFTRQKLVDAINKMTDYTANGLLPHVDWTKAHEEPDPCFAIMKVVAGKPKPVFGKPGKPFVCLPPTLKKIPTNPEVG